MGFFFFEVSILEWVFCENLDDWPTLFCRTSRIEVASKCWKAYRRYCLKILRTSLMKRLPEFFPCFIELGYSWVQGSLVTPCFVRAVLDTTCTFHFPSIGEVMLTPYDFLTSKEIKSLLGVMPSKLKSKNVSLMWLYENIENCKTIATSTCMFMLLFIGTFLCPDLGSTVSLCYLWSLRDIG